MLPKLMQAEPLQQPAPLSPEEIRAQKNAAGRARGCADCPICGDSYGWKNFHNVDFYVGHIVGTDGKAGTKGSVGIAAICEECWPKLTPEERLPYLLAVIDQWIERVPGVKKKVIHPAGKFSDEIIDDPDDVARREDQLAELAEIRKLVTEKILAGA